jgi:hypothetical protein
MKHISKIIFAALLFVFSSISMAEDTDFSLEAKPRRVSNYELTHSCVDQKKVSLRSYSTILYFGTNSKGEHKYGEFFSNYQEVDNLNKEVTFRTGYQKIYDSSFRNIVGGSGYVEGKPQPFLPENIATGESVTLPYEFASALGKISGKFTTKIAAISADGNTVSNVSSFPHNDTGLWTIESRISKSKSFPGTWFFNSYKISAKNGPICFEEYSARRMEASEIQPNIK